MPFQVKVKLLKEMYHVDLDVDAPPIEFGKAVEAETGVPPGMNFHIGLFMMKFGFTARLSQARLIMVK